MHETKRTLSGKLYTAYRQRLNVPIILQEKLARFPAAMRRQIEKRHARLAEIVAAEKERYYSIKELTVLWALPRRAVKKLVISERAGVVISEHGGVVTVCSKNGHFSYMVPESVVQRIRPRRS